MRLWLKTNRGVGAVLAIVIVAYLLHLQAVSWAHERMRDGFTLGFFPIVGSVAMLVCSVILIVDSRRKEVAEELSSAGWKGVLLSLSIIGGCYVYFELMLRLGFLFVSPFFLFGFIYALGLREMKSAVASACVMTIIIYALFRLIGISLPQGITPI